jgi:hypothetical protein
MRRDEIAQFLDPPEALLAAVVERAIRDAGRGCTEAQEFLQAIELQSFIEEHKGRNSYEYEIRSVRH